MTLLSSYLIFVVIKKSLFSWKIYSDLSFGQKRGCTSKSATVWSQLLSLKMLSRVAFDGIGENWNQQYSGHNFLLKSNQAIVRLRIKLLLGLENLTVLWCDLKGENLTKTWNFLWRKNRRQARFDTLVKRPLRCRSPKSSTVLSPSKLCLVWTQKAFSRSK